MTFPHVATIRRMTESGDKFTYEDSGSTMCFLQPASQEMAESFALTFTKGSIVYLPLDSDVHEKDRLVINGVTYGVKGVKTHDYGSIAHKKAGVESL